MADGFNEWALVELMGHQRIVGKCSEQEIAGAKLLRVDVPKLGDAGRNEVLRAIGYLRDHAA